MHLKDDKDLSRGATQFEHGKINDEEISACHDGRDRAWRRAGCCRGSSGTNL
jgi:hypothetical protein